MFRVMHTTAIATLLLIGLMADRASAAFVLIGPQTGTVAVNPFFPLGTPPGNTTVATGIISSSNFVTWSSVGPDPGGGVTIPGNVLSNPITTGTPISAVRLVTGSPGNPLLASPPASPTGTLERRTTGFSATGDYTANEALLFANLAGGALIVDFALPVSAAGFRVQRDALGPDATFFLQAFNETTPGGPYAPATPLYNGNVNTNSFQPLSDTAPFYGIQGNPNETFTRLWIGFGSGGPFTISTLEMIQGQGSGGSAVPVPPTLYAGLFGAFGLAALRRLRRKA